MSFKLQRLNVVRIVTEKNEAEALVKKGFTLLKEEAEKVTETIEKDLSLETVAGLKEKAVSLGIEVPAIIKKDELIELIKAKS